MRMFSTIFQSEDGLIGDDGMAARGYPEHWKGANGLYCAGMVRRGIYGSCEDAELIARATPPPPPPTPTAPSS
jgi:hypothetical protein